MLGTCQWNSNAVFVLDDRTTPTCWRRVLLCFCVSQLTREYFSRELRRHYQGRNNTDVFTSTWNVVMTTVSRLSCLAPPTCRTAFMVWFAPDSLTAAEWADLRTSRRVSSGSWTRPGWFLSPAARGPATSGGRAWSSAWGAAWPSGTTRSENIVSCLVPLD